MSDTSACKKEVYQVKEDLLLKNFLERSRSDKAKVLRLQQLKNFRKRQENASHNTVSRVTNHTNIGRQVYFHPGSLIQDAIKEGNKYEVLNCLSSGVPINFKDVHGEGMPLLHQSCIYDDYIIAQALIKKGASVNLKDDYGATPLHICCLWDSMKCAQLLLANNADTNIVDVDGNFPVDVAPENSHLKSMMRKHMQQRSKIDDDQLQSLRNQTQKAMVQDICRILQEGNSVDTTSTAGISLLHIAVANGYVTAARMLLENSANVNAADMQMWTPLHCAAKYRQAKMVRLLLSHYANPHARTSSNFTPRELAKDQEITKMLSNAEDTFLDLDKQRTPAKPKRFSTSLLDRCEDEDELSQVRTRVISSTKISKRDVANEKGIINELKEELKQELKSEMYFEPPESNLSLQGFPTWHQLMPPPVPPRDERPQVQSPLSPVGKKQTWTNQLHDEKLLRAVITIQRGLRRYLASRDAVSPLSAALRKVEDYGSSFYEQMVIQNAEDIARESDRRRSLKSHYRNSWCADRRFATWGAKARGRPLSTGVISMTHSPDPNAIWLPQSSLQNPYSQIPPDVVPRYTDNVDYWGTMPRGVGGGEQRQKSLKISASSIDSGVSVDSNHKKDFIELAGTVRRSLSISAQSGVSRAQHFGHSAPFTTRKHSMPVLRSPVQSTYRMPPLTPTVATLIHTAAVAQTEAPPTSKVMKPVTTTTAPTTYDNVYFNATLPSNYHSTRSVQSGRKYGTILSNKNDIFQESQIQNLGIPNNIDPANNRHSWNCEDESSTDFGSKSMKTTQHFASSYSSDMQYSDGIQCSLDSIPNSSSTSSIPSTSGRRSSRGSDSMPPPPPRRAPSTRLSGSNENTQAAPPVARKPSLGKFTPDPMRLRNNTQPNLYLPVRKHHDSESSTVFRHDSYSEDDLPVLPPPLPLYIPQAMAPKVARRNGDPSDFEFPAPPPPDVLLYDTMKSIGSLRKKREEIDNYLDFPPPPPTL